MKKKYLLQSLGRCLQQSNNNKSMKRTNKNGSTGGTCTATTSTTGRRLGTPSWLCRSLYLCLGLGSGLLLLLLLLGTTCLQAPMCLSGRYTEHGLLDVVLDGDADPGQHLGQQCGTARTTTSRATAQSQANQRKNKSTGS